MKSQITSSVRLAGSGHEHQKNNFSRVSKKLLTFAIALVPALFFGQAAFEKFESDNDFTSVVVNKKTFSMLAQVKTDETGKEAQQVKEMASQIEFLKVFTTEKANAAQKLGTASDSYIKSSGLEELMQVKEKGATFKIFVKSGAKETQITEILVFVNDKADAKKEAGAALIIVKGLFDMEELSDLTEKVLPKATDANIDSKLAEVKDALILKVSPNPATGVFYINTDQSAEVKLYDQSGRLVKTQKYTAEGISTSGITPGTYLVEINTEGRRQTEHLVIK